MRRHGKDRDTEKGDIPFFIRIFRSGDMGLRHRMMTILSFDCACIMVKISGIQEIEKEELPTASLLSTEKEGACA